jgi:hypothetical protein
MGLLESRSLTVKMDYGQFHLVSGFPSPKDVSGEEQEDADNIVDRTIDEGNEIGQSVYGLCVLCPHQNNFAMVLLVERWDAEPPDDLADWQEAFDAVLPVRETGLYYQPVVANEQWDLHVPAGTYAVRIAGRGFVARGWPGTTTPGDEWRIQLWPGTAAAPPRHLKRWEPA